MRMSVDSPESVHYRVYLDGRELGMCIEADEDEGWAVVWQTDRDGNIRWDAEWSTDADGNYLYGEDAKPLTELVRGRIELRRTA